MTDRPTRFQSQLTPLPVVPPRPKLPPEKHAQVKRAAEVQIDNFRDTPTSAKDEKRMLIDGANRYQIKGNEDGSIALLKADGSVERTIAKDGLQSKSEKNPLTVAILLLALGTHDEVY